MPPSLLFFSEEAPYDYNIKNRMPTPIFHLIREGGREGREGEAWILKMELVVFHEMALSVLELPVGTTEREEDDVVDELDLTRLTEEPTRAST